MFNNKFIYNILKLYSFLSQSKKKIDKDLEKGNYRGKQETPKVTIFSQITCTHALVQYKAAEEPTNFSKS